MRGYFGHASEAAPARARTGSSSQPPSSKCNSSFENCQDESKIQNFHEEHVKSEDMQLWTMLSYLVPETHLKKAKHEHEQTMVQDNNLLIDQNKELAKSILHMERKFAKMNNESLEDSDCDSETTDASTIGNQDTKVLLDERDTLEQESHDMLDELCGVNDAMDEPNLAVEETVTSLLQALADERRQRKLLQEEYPLVAARLAEKSKCRSWGSTRVLRAAARRATRAAFLMGRALQALLWVAAVLAVMLLVPFAVYSISKTSSLRALRAHVKYNDAHGKEVILLEHEIDAKVSALTDKTSAGALPCEKQLQSAQRDTVLLVQELQSARTARAEVSQRLLLLADDSRRLQEEVRKKSTDAKELNNKLSALQIELNLKKSRVAEMEAHAADPGAAPREDHDQRAAQELASMQAQMEETARGMEELQRSAERELASKAAALAELETQLMRSSDNADVQQQILQAEVDTLTTRVQLLEGELKAQTDRYDFLLDQVDTGVRQECPANACADHKTQAEALELQVSHLQRELALKEENCGSSIKEVERGSKTECPDTNSPDADAEVRLLRLQVDALEVELLEAKRSVDPVPAFQKLLWEQMMHSSPQRKMLYTALLIGLALIVCTRWSSRSPEALVLGRRDVHAALAGGLRAGRRLSRASSLQGTPRFVRPRSRGSSALPSPRLHGVPEQAWPDSPSVLQSWFQQSDMQETRLTEYLPGSKSGAPSEGSQSAFALSSHTKDNLLIDEQSTYPTQSSIPIATKISAPPASPERRRTSHVLQGKQGKLGQEAEIHTHAVIGKAQMAVHGGLNSSLKQDDNESFESEVFDTPRAMLTPSSNGIAAQNMSYSEGWEPAIVSTTFCVSESSVAEPHLGF